MQPNPLPSLITCVQPTSEVVSQTNRGAYTHVRPPASPQNKQQKRKGKKINREHEERRSKSAQKEALARFARTEVPPRHRGEFRLVPPAAIRECH